MNKARTFRKSLPLDRNLNEKPVADGDYRSEWPKFNGPKDYSVTSASEEISVYFRNLLPRLLEHIQHADAVVGCMAWLTNGEILRALETRVTSIVVTKKTFSEELLEEYSKLYSTTPEMFDNVLRALSASQNEPLDPIRCIGYHKPKPGETLKGTSEQNEILPLMHNKFLVFCRKSYWGSRLREYIPYAVWTGSFNLSNNATRSLENALYITEPEIVHAYFHEYGQIMALSEPITGHSTDFRPEWHIR